MLRNSIVLVDSLILYYVMIALVWNYILDTLTLLSPPTSTLKTDRHLPSIASRPQGSIYSEAIRKRRRPFESPSPSPLFENRQIRITPFEAKGEVAFFLRKTNWNSSEKLENRKIMGKSILIHKKILILPLEKSQLMIDDRISHFDCLFY